MKKLLIITFVLSLVFFKSQAQDSWTQGYLTGQTAVSMGGGYINIVSDELIDVNAVQNNNLQLVFMYMVVTVETPEGTFSFSNHRGDSWPYMPSSGTPYTPIDYPDNTLQINTPVSASTYSSITFEYYAAYQDSSNNITYNYINQTIL